MRDHLCAGFMTALVLFGSMPARIDADALSGTTLPWFFSGTVTETFRIGNTLYVAGGFRSVSPRQQHVGAFVDLTLASASPRLPHPRIEGAVEAVVDDGAGGWFVGGNELTVNGGRAASLIHLRADGSLDPSFASGINGPVLALARGGNVVYVGGAFTQAFGAARTNLAAFNIGGGVLSFDPDPNAPVRAIVVLPTAVFVGGHFTIIARQPRGRGAAFSLLTGLGLMVWDPQLVSFGAAQINAMVASANHMYIGGEFDGAGNVGGRNLIALDLIQGFADTRFSSNTEGPVKALALTANRLFVGGSFDRIRGVDVSGLASVNPVTGSPQEWAADLDGPSSTGLGFENEVTSLAAVGDTLFVGGEFASIGGAPRSNLAAVSIDSRGNVLPWNPGLDRRVNAVAATSGAIAVGGNFERIGAHVRQGLASVDLVTGELLPLSADIDGVVSALAVSGTTLYIGGQFSHVDGEPRARLAAFDAASGALLPWAPAVNGTTVLAMAAVGANVFVGGAFSEVAGRPGEGLAVVDATTGAARTTFASFSFTGVVQDLEVVGTTVFVGGTFAVFGGATRANLAAFDVSSLQLTAFHPLVDGSINGLAAVNGVLYVAGSSATVDGQARLGFWAIDISTGRATTWAPDVDRAGNDLAALDDAVYLAGSFTTVNGFARDGFAAVDPSTGRVTSPWQADGHRENGRHVAAFRDLVITGGDRNGGVFAESRMTGLPGPPTSLTATIHGNALRLEWSASMLGGRPADYLVEAGTAASTSNIGIITNGSAAPHFSIGGVPPGLYFLRVRARNGSGVSRPSPEIAVAVGVPGCAGPPGAVAGLTPLVSGVALNLKWPSAPGNATRYALRVGTAPELINVGTFDLGAGNLFAVTASPGVFFARAVATSACGIGPPSSQTLIPLGGVSPPAAPLVAATVSARSVAVAWTASPGATSFRLEAGTGPLLANAAVVPTAATSLLAANVPSGTYYVRVYAIGAFGASFASNEVVVMVP